MQLSAFTDYSLRVLVYVALQPDRTSVTEITEAYGVSRSHLVKVVHRLQALGYLNTFRGRSGGIELGRTPSQVRVGELVAELENLQLVECFKEGNSCALTGHCVLQQTLIDARDAFLATLNRVTLADLLQPSNALARALAIPGR